MTLTLLFAILCARVFRDLTASTFLLACSFLVFFLLSPFAFFLLAFAAFFAWLRFLLTALFFVSAFFFAIYCLAAERLAVFRAFFFVWIFLVAPFFIEALLLLTTLGGSGVCVFFIFESHFCR